MDAAGESSRMFLALPVPDSVKLRLKSAQSELRALLPADGISWTRPENFHLTIRFLGKVATEQIEALKAVLATVVEESPPLDLVARRVGCFPNLRHPRVLWASVYDAAGVLQELHRRLNAAVAPFTGEPAAKEFAGHVTLARFRHARRSDAECLSGFLDRSAEREFGSWRPGELMLMASDLRPGGSHYTCLAVLPFCGGMKPPA